MPVVGYVHSDPLICIPGTGVQIDDFAVFIGNGFVQSKHRFFDKFRGNAVVDRGLTEAYFLHVVQIFGHGIFIPVDPAVNLIYDGRHDKRNKCYSERCTSNDEQRGQTAQQSTYLDNTGKKGRFCNRRAHRACDCRNTHGNACGDLGNAKDGHA